MRRYHLPIFIIILVFAIPATSAGAAGSSSHAAEWTRPTEQALKIIDGLKDAYLSKLPVTVPVTAAQAGLHPVPVLASFDHRINSRLLELLADSYRYNYEDWHDGIARAELSGFVVTTRYKGTIVDDLQIGDAMSQAIARLGEPSYRKADEIYYRTGTFYLGLKGQDRIESAIILSVPIQPEDKMALRKTVEALNENDSLQEFAEINPTGKSVFGRDGHIHGGGWFAWAVCGIEIEDFDDRVIRVYNNYEGKLYRTTGQSSYTIEFVDADREIEHAHWSLESERQLNNRFAEEGQPSPGGQYRAVYDWYNSEHHFFTIRSTDFSRPDIIIHGPYSNFLWVSDDEMIAASAWFGELELIRVTNPDAEIINVLDRIAGLKGKYTADSQIDIVRESANTFTLLIDEKPCRVRYSVDKKGEIRFTLI